MDTKALILDFDGTLADTRPLILHTMRRTAAAMGLPAVTDEACAATIGLPLRQCFQQLWTVDDAAADRCVSLYRRFFDEDNRPGTVVCFPGVGETLAELHGKGMRLAVCSSRGRKSLDAFLHEMGIDRLVEAVVGAEDVSRAKPDPEPVQQLLSRMGLAPEEVLVVGDAAYDILMGRAAGCRTCGVTYGNQSAADLHKAGADWLVDEFPALTAII